MKSVRTSVLAAALTVLASITLASAARSAESALLDVRTTGVLDNCTRPNEVPLSQGGNWSQDITGPTGGLELVGNRCRRGPGTTSWRTATVPSGDAEVWGQLALNQPGENDEWIGLYLHLQNPGTGNVDGYRARMGDIFVGPRVWEIHRVADGGFTLLAQVGASNVGAGNYLIFRREGSLLRFGWEHASTGVFTTMVTATDTTYTAGHLGAYISTDDSQFAQIGGGSTEPPSSSGVPPEQTFGTGEDGCGVHGCSGAGLFADPVSSRTGAFTTAVDDLELPGTGVSFAWSRSYTSADETVGRLGPGWTDAYSASLDVQGNGDVRLHGEDGQQLYYTRQGDGSFVGAPGARSTLTSVTGGYELKRTDQVVYRFDAQGRLLSMKDRNGQGVTLGYDGSWRLTTVTDAANRQATISYSAQDLVSQVQTPDGRSVGYGYTSGRLTSVTDVRGKTWTYAYDAGGRLATIVDPLNHTQVTNVYGADGRVTSQTDALAKTTAFAWNESTMTATATDADQKVWTHDYDADGVLVEEVDPLGNDSDLVRDADLNTTSVTGPTDETTAMTYDGAGNLLTATAPPSLGSAQKTFLYNARNDPTQVTDARGKVTAYTYDGDGNLASVTQDGVQVASYTYDGAGRVLTFTDGNEKTWTYTYVPATGYLASSSDPLGNTTTYTYDAAGRMATRVDPKGNVPGCSCAADFTWTYTYNAAGQQLTEQNPLGHTTTNVYDDAGRLTSTSNGPNRTTSYTYDDANRVLTETAPDPDGAGPLAAPVTTYTYDDVGNKLTETDPRGATTTFAYDGANRLVSETGPDPDGGGPLAAPVTTHTYDPNGNLASTVEPRGNVAGATPSDYRTTFTYDAAGRLLTTTDPLGNVTTNVYDPVGNLASVRDASNHTTAYSYDAAGRILTVTAPDGGLTTYAYDDAGNLVSRSDDNAHATTIAYDAAGRLLSETSPDPDGPGPQGPAVTTHTYDPNGNLLTTTDPNGNATQAAGDGVTTYGYDRANRQVSIDYADSTPDVAFTYDAVGNRLTMTEVGVGTETRTYDFLDRLLSVSRGPNTTFAYAYDKNGNVTQHQDPDPNAPFINYSYDALNRLTSVANGSVTSYEYDAASNLTRTNLPANNGYVEQRIYDRAGRLTELRSDRAGVLLARFVATLDPVGNPTQVVRTGSLAQTQTYTYDAADRLTSVCFQAGTCPGASDPYIRWTYDRVGNRLSEQRPADTTTYAYDARDRLLSAGSTSFAYDQNGNELSAGNRTSTYDLANRLRTLSQGNTTTTYTYDGDSKRLQASTGNQAAKKTNFVWDVNFRLPQISVERDGNNTRLRRYIYGHRRISMLPTSGFLSYYIYDGLGSVANLVSQTGTTTQWTWSYEPFGNIRTEQKASGQQPANFLKFTGEYLDPSGLYHLRARQYDPGVGRFLRPDPVTAATDSANVAAYVYAADRPTVFDDPSGETMRLVNSGRAVVAFAVSLADSAAPPIVCQAGLCGRKPLPVPPTTCGARPGHPLSRIGVFLGGPYAGTHTRGNWQSDRAVDIGVPVGTKVCAVFSGQIGPRIGPLNSSDPALAGLRLTLIGNRDEAYYAHLSRILVKKDDSVRSDQLLGYSGAAGAPHLHIALKRGDPRRFCRADAIGASC